MLFLINNYFQKLMRSLAGGFIQNKVIQNSKI